MDKKSDELDAFADELSNAYKSKIISKTCDLESEDERTAFCNYIKNIKVNILINNAAFVGESNLQGWVGPLNNQSIETWNRALNVNLTAPFDFCKEISGSMKGQAGASIINIASIYASRGPSWKLYENTLMGNPAAYGVSKAGLVQLTRWMAATLAPFIRVNSISPGGIFRGQNERFVQRYKDATLLGRMATEADIAGAVAYLSSDLSEYVTGIDLVVDGGKGVI